MKSTNFGHHYDEIIREPRMQALYGDSGYFNVGYWADGSLTLPHACDRLVDELATTIPHGAQVIVDVGCGKGAGTRRLMERFPDALVVAGNISQWQLAQARSRGVTAPVVMDAARLPLASNVADAIVALESAQHFDTRARFFAEARRVLRPGGIIALADMLFHDREPIGAWLLPEGNRAVDLTGYEELLTAAGFHDVHVRDITDVSWHPFCDVMRSVFSGHDEQVEAYRNSISHYVLAFARAA